MKKETLFFLFIMILGIWMIIRTFFGGNNETNLDWSNTNWFIWNLTNTWEYLWADDTEIKADTWIASNQVTQNTIITWDEEKKTYYEIKVMMPKYFYTSWWRNFAKDLFDEQKIYMNFTFMDDLNFYRDLISDTDFSDADIFLFPYDWKEIVQTRAFSPESNMQWYFDSLITPITKDSQIKFLPFAIDPMIMYTSLNPKENSFTAISDNIFSRQSNMKLAFPLFFGITSADYDHKWFIREYQDIVRYALLHYFKTYQDSHSLWIRIDNNIFQDSQEIRSYNLDDLNHISTIITLPECKNFPSICFQVYNFVWMRFWFLSDADVVQQYFSHKKSKFDQISKTTVPFSQIESPVRLRWRWINKSLENKDKINAIYSFIIKYMNEHDKYSLRSSTLPVFKIEWHPLSENEYIGTRWYILSEWWNYIDTLRGNNYFRDLLEHKITAKDYLRK